MIEAYLIEWLNLSVRFLHMIAGIAWIGASFYFNWLENKLNRQTGQKQNIAGHLWAVHGGGFYYLEKYKTYPNKLPETLHWFKWEAYVTWLSGFALLSIIYYLGASTYLVTPESSLTPSWAVMISVLGLVIGWLFYDALCKLMADKPVLISILLAVFIAVATYGYFQLFTPRGATIQIGSMIGTIMVANVFFVIIPVQKALVKACVDKTPISTALGLTGYTRSRHNNYLTLPVLFVMISAHYPMVYSHSYGWLTLLVVFVISVLIRHYFNLRGVGAASKMWVIGIVLSCLTLVAALTPWQQMNSQQDVTFSQVREIINARCVSCHSATPSDDVFRVTPNGFMLDSDEQINAARSLIYARTIASESMPLNNKTKMSTQERQVLADWLSQEIVQ